ncbi:hypothetical protein Q5752_001354 [Cryptotrichosporon argae]
MASTSRPEPKRVKTDADHGAAAGNSASDAAVADAKGGAHDAQPDKHEGEDWLKRPPFQVGYEGEWTTRWRESCWCGKTAFVFNADPLQSKICHCEDCQRLHGAPFQHSAIFKKDAIKLDSSPEWLGFLSAHGEVHALSSSPTPLPRKTSCRACGSPLFDEGRNMVMAFPPSFEFARGGIDEKGSGSGAGKSSGDDGDAHANAQASTAHGETQHEGTRADAKANKGPRPVGLPDVFKAKAHIFYERRTMDVPDGLPKWSKHMDESEQIPETGSWTVDNAPAKKA